MNYLFLSEQTFDTEFEKISWVKCNKDFRGYYVTDYSTENFETLAALLKKDNFYTVSLLRFRFMTLGEGVERTWVSYEIRGSCCRRCRIVFVCSHAQ